MNLLTPSTRTWVRRAVLVATLPSLLLTAHVHAGTTCVSTAGQLNSAIIAAETNNQGDDIRIRVGTYVAPIPDGFYYYPPSNDDEPSDVTVSGGWNADCSEAIDDATLTVLSGNLQTSVLRFRNANGTMTVRNLTITDGYVESGVIGALHFDHISGFGLAARVERVILHHNATYAALYVKTRGGIHVEDSLFHSNLALNTGAGGAHIVANNALTGTRIYNNTFAYNEAMDGSTVGGLLFENGSGTQSYINNNIFWGNDNSDLGVVGIAAEHTDCGYNDVGVFDDVTVCNGVNVFFDPGFTDPTAEDFRLATNSPLIDIGCSAIQCAYVPVIDLRGIARPQGDGYDLGAYEGGYGLSDLIFADGFN